MKKRLFDFSGLAIAVFAVASFGPSVGARAALINVDFNTTTPAESTNSPTQTGAAVIGSAGDIWNPSTAGNFTGQALVTSTGAASGVTMDVNAAAVFDSATTSTPFASSPVKPLMQDFLYNFGGNNTVTLHGLAAGPYELIVYSVGDQLAGSGPQQRETGFNANGATATVGPNNGVGVLTPGLNYAILDPIVTSNGTLTIVSSNVSGGTPQFNGFQLEIVPEPASLAALAGLCGMGLISLVLRRRSAA